MRFKLTTRSRHLFSCYLAIGLLALGSYATAQTDSTDLKFSTEELDNEMWNRKVKLKTLPYSLPDDTKNVLSIGIELERQLYPDFFRTYGPTPVDASIAYERKLFTPAFSFIVEGSTRFLGYRHWMHDFIDEVWDRTLASQTLGNRRFWLNAEVRYYYNKLTRHQGGRSGNNVFGQYVAIKLENVVSVVHELSREYTTGEVSGILLKKSERTIVNSRPTQLILQWGIQQRIAKHFFVDFRVQLASHMDRYSRTFLLRGEAPWLNLRLGYLIFAK